MQKEQRQLHFERVYDLEIGDYKETSGLIKDGLYSWKLLPDNNTYEIESTEENIKHREYFESKNAIVFGYSSKTLISKDGFFYDKFDCLEYEWVVRLYDSDYYICRKNTKYGVIDANGNIIIDIVFPLITRLPKVIDIDIDELYWYEPPHVRQIRKEALGENTKPYIILKITTEKGEHLLELTTFRESRTYDKIYTFGKNYLIKQNGLFGIITRMGEELVPPIYSKADYFPPSLSRWAVDERYWTGGWIETECFGYKVPIANNGKYYGEIPYEFTGCYRVDERRYLVEQNGKCGLIEYQNSSKKLGVIIPIEYISILLDNNRPSYDNRPFSPVWIKNSDGIAKPFCFAIVQDDDGYQLYNMASQEQREMGEHYHSLKFAHNGLPRAEYKPPFFIAERDDKYAILSQAGVQITDFVYQSIYGMIGDDFIVCKDDKWTIINRWGKQLFNCEWDDINDALHAWQNSGRG